MWLLSINSCATNYSIQISNNRAIDTRKGFPELEELYSASTLDLIVVNDLDTITFKTKAEPYTSDQSDKNNELTRAETIAIIISYLNDVIRKFYVPLLATFDGSLDSLDPSSNSLIEAYLNHADLVLEINDWQLEKTGLVDIDIRKCKHGQIDNINLYYCEELACFDSMELEDL